MRLKKSIELKKVSKHKVSKVHNIMQIKRPITTLA